MLVKRLLTPDLAKRYGNLRNGVADIKEHKWFAGFDWNSLLKKQMPPPYKPVFKVSIHGFPSEKSTKIRRPRPCSAYPRYTSTSIQGTAG